LCDGWAAFRLNAFVGEGHRCPTYTRPAIPFPTAPPNVRGVPLAVSVLAELPAVVQSSAPWGIELDARPVAILKRAGEHQSRHRQAQHATKREGTEEPS